MNGVRTTFLRRGYLLTALAAAVLLAASPGTALAQSVGVGFVGSSGSVAENATSAPTTPALLKVKVRVTGLPGENATDPTRASVITSKLGNITYEIRDAANATADQISVAPTGNLDFSSNDEVTLTITPTADNNWKNEKYTITLDSSVVALAPSPATFTVTVNDDEDAPRVEFTRTSVKLTEDSQTDVSVRVVSSKTGKAFAADAPQTTNDNSDAIGEHSADLKVNVSPANLAKSILVGGDAAAACPTTNTPLLSIWGGGTAGEAAMLTTSSFTISSASTLEGTAGTLNLKACGDMSGYRDSVITFSFDDKSLAPASATSAAGNILAGSPLVLTIESDEAKPTVSFSTSDINIDEGGTQTLYLVADTDQGDEVGMADVMVSGDARIELTGDNVEAGDDVDDYGNGTYTVEFGTSANTKVTVMAKGDESLADGQTAMGMLKITDASGATIGADSTVSVTVRGSTSVPALPLIAQLLLALFLMAGGSRLYRRRRG